MHPKRLLHLLLEYNTIVICLVMILISSMISDVFFTTTNLANLLRQVSGIGILSLGMLLVILTGGIDLSVGSMVAMTSVLCGIFILNMPLPVAILCTILAGILAGALSGYLVSIHRIAPFIATLALMTVVRGLGFIFSKGSPVILAEKGAILTSLGSGYLLGIPNPVILMLLVFISVAILLRYTVFGRLVEKAGSSAARPTRIQLPAAASKHGLPQWQTIGPGRHGR